MTILSVLIAFLLVGCYYNSEEVLYPELPGSCDTSLISYSADVHPILQANCVICHSNVYAATLGGNIQLDDFADVSSQSDVLLNAIQHTGDASPMPKGGAKLIYCDILKIKAWINQGKNDN